MADNIHKTEGLERIVSGIHKTVDIIKGTYGPGGGNIILEEELYPFHSIRNDGKTIVDKIKLEDPIENIGANIIKEAGDKADKESGEGRKTTMLLVDAIFENKDSTEFPMNLKRSLDDCLPLITKEIDSQKKEIGVNEVEPIATIASENKTIGKLIQEIYQNIDKEGIIEIDNSNTFDTFYEIKDGVRFRKASYISPYMATNDDKAVYKKPHILITRQKISTLSDLSIFEKLEAQGIKDIVIVCDEIDNSVVGPLITTNVRGIFKSLVIKAPTLWKDWFFEDFAKLTGATIIGTDSGTSLKNVELEHLGSCEMLITDRDETRLIGTKDISEHLNKLEKASQDDDQLKIRISFLQTKVAILKVGANSESELSHISKKAKDGCSAAYLALKDGVVKGGGLALYDISELMPNTPGGRILRKALKVPHTQIKENMNIQLKGRVKFDEKVLDPAIVVKNAIKNAISIAGINLTAKGVIIK